MAEIPAATAGKRKSQSLKVDLTPMVDLGFLLISFFVFTNTLSEPGILPLVMPDDSGTYTDIPVSGSVTLIAAADKILYYEGFTPENIDSVVAIRFQQKDLLRQRLLGLKQRLISANGNDDKLVAMIKPGDESRLGQLVGLLDEMRVCGIKRYAICELNRAEKEWMSPGN